jgi:hypothetical protein
MTFSITTEHNDPQHNVTQIVAFFTVMRSVVMLIVLTLSFMGPIFFKNNTIIPWPRHTVKKLDITTLSITRLNLI